MPIQEYKGACKNVKLLVIGSRSIIDFDLSAHIPEGVDLIISGGAVGIDTLAEDYADTHGIKKLIIRPQYSKYGKIAPLKRNEVMVDSCDKVLAIWNGKSKGTEYTINYARRKEKTVIEIMVKE